MPPLQLTDVIALLNHSLDTSLIQLPHDLVLHVLPTVQFTREIATITSDTLGATSPFYPSMHNSSVKLPLFVIPVDQNASSMLSYNDKSHFRQDIDFGSAREVAQLSLELRNPDGEILDPGIDWSILLEYQDW